MCRRGSSLDPKTLASEVTIIFCETKATVKAVVHHEGYDLKVMRRESVADVSLGKVESLLLEEQINEGFSLRSSGAKVFEIGLILSDIRFKIGSYSHK